ncbi:unnamed protein product, partial [Owenia fusiformis]
TYYEFNDNDEKIHSRASLATDGDTTTCARTNGGEEPTFTLSFGREYYVHSIRITVGALPYKHFGCFGDDWERALDWNIDAEDIDYLNDDYWNRVLEVKKCFTAVTANSKTIIGVLNGGICYTSRSGYGTYNKYGTSNKCTGSNRNGEQVVGTGGPWAMDVYAITGDPLRYS